MKKYISFPRRTILFWDGNEPKVINKKVVYANFHNAIYIILKCFVEGITISNKENDQKYSNIEWYIFVLLKILHDDKSFENCDILT